MTVYIALLMSYEGLLCVQRNKLKIITLKYKHITHLLQPIYYIYTRYKKNNNKYVNFKARNHNIVPGMGEWNMRKWQNENMRLWKLTNVAMIKYKCFLLCIFILEPVQSVVIAGDMLVWARPVGRISYYIVTIQDEGDNNLIEITTNEQFVSIPENITGNFEVKVYTKLQ